MLKYALKENLRPSSVDLRLHSIHRAGKVKVIDIDLQKTPPVTEVKLPYTLKPGEYVLAQTIEELDQPNPRYACLLSARSRALRNGLDIKVNFFGPYYKGRIFFGIKNIGENPVVLKRGLSLLQIAFFDIKGKTVPVKHVYQGGRLI